MSRKLAELLVKERIIQPAQLTEAESAALSGKNPVKHLIEKNYLTEVKLLTFLTQKFSLPSINISKYDIKPEVINLVAPELARKNQAIPIQSSKGTLVVAIWDPTIIPQLTDIKFATKLNVEPVVTTISAFESVFAKYYQGTAAVATDAINAFKKKDDREKAESVSNDMHIELVDVHDIDSQNTAADAPVIALVNSIFSECLKRGASDIHVEPYEKSMRVRMRIDGSMINALDVPVEMKRAVIARFKIMSRMDISESRIPQDGRIKLKSGGRDIDFRVNSMPTLFGEKIVLRVLSKGNLQLDLLKLGFEKKQLEVFRKGIYAPNGLCLVTGPTGSGKTTTLYSALTELNLVTDNLSTAEDPVEYNLEGINQVQINKEVGLTFATVLRALLRQDPDSILVGEIRDYETAEVAVQAALTGHLVLSTLHTNDSVSTVTRLMNMGLEPFLVVASVNVIVAQRLIRKICPDCKVEMPLPREQLLALVFPATSLDKIKLYHGTGCKTCNSTGYKGRVAIYEVLDFTETLKDLVLKGASVIDLKKQAIKDGLKTLRQSALTKVIEGQSTLEEALSSTTEN